MKKVIIFIVIAALVLTVTPALIYAENGPVEKATGSITIWNEDGSNYWEVEFNAHEGNDSKEAKGKLKINAIYADGSPKREFEYDVGYVRVEPNGQAHFGAYCYSDSWDTLDGSWFYVQVIDGGTPGTAGDKLGWKWGTTVESVVASWVSSGVSTNLRLVTDGNLVVHLYE